MDLFELAMLAEEKGLDCIDTLLDNDTKNNYKSKNLKLIGPKKFNWTKFESDNDRKEKLKEYKYLGSKNIFKYISNDLEYPCSIIGYLNVKNEYNYDNLVLEFENNRLHVILADYFSDMQK